MFTKIDLCTMALLKLGEKPIQSLTDDGAAAQLARTLFDATIDTLLSLHPWRFATRTMDLVKNDDGNFLVPAEVLRVLRCPGDLRGDRIYCGADKISIDALVRVGPESFPGYFSTLAAAKLAVEFCMPLTGDNGMFRTMVAVYESELQAAKYMDSASSPSRGVANFSLIDARF